MMERGDKYYMAICNKTGMISIYNSSRNLFMSPMADGPIKYTGSLNDSDKMSVINVTQFGRSFSLVCIPYTLKLLIQELQCMNITMRIITEENIEQIETLAFSRNIDKLTKRSVGNLREVTHDIRRILQLEQQAKNKSDLPAQLSSISSDEGYNIVREYNPTTPEGIPPIEQLPQGAPGPTAYVESVSSEVSSKYSPGSPANIEIIANEGSPAYAEGSPAYAEDLKKGGFNNTNDEFQINDLVQIRGGTSKTWRIKEKGPRFTTLENMAPTNDEDTIKIVEPHQIYHATNIAPTLKMPTEYDMYGTIDRGAEGNILPVSTMPNMYAMPPGGIQINPTFVVGDNNTLPNNGGGSDPVPFNGGAVPSDIGEPSKTIGNSILPEKKIQFKENIEEDSENKTSGSGGEVSSNSFFDFLKIRKIM